MAEHWEQHERGTMRGCPVVAGKCPACGAASLGLGAGGHVTCASLFCADPVAADRMLTADDDGPLLDALAALLDEMRHDDVVDNATLARMTLDRVRRG